jgi:hypothetical protein
MTHIDMPDLEARRLLRLLESQGRAERFPTTVKQLRRTLGSPTLSASLASGDAVGRGSRNGDHTSRTDIFRTTTDGSSTAGDHDGAGAGSQQEP